MSEPNNAPPASTPEGAASPAATASTVTPGPGSSSPTAVGEAPAPVADAKPAWTPPRTVTKASTALPARVKIPARPSVAEAVAAVATEEAAAAAPKATVADGKSASAGEPNSASPADGKTSPTSSASAEAKKPVDGQSSSDTPRTDDPKGQGRASKAWQAMLEKEAALTQVQQDVKPLVEAKELVAKGKKLEALAKLGLTLEDLQAEYLASIREETPEDTARRVAREELTAQQNAATEAAAAAERARKDAENNERQIVVINSLNAIEKALVGFTPEDLRYTRAANVDAGAVARWYYTTHGKLPTDGAEALRGYEGHLRSLIAPPAPAAPAPAAAPVAKPAPTTLTAEATGEVPLAKRPNAPQLSAIERARQIMSEMGVSN